MEKNFKENYDRHFYLYAKKWYEKGDVLNDLMYILSEYTGIDMQYITESMVYEKMIDLAYYSIKGNDNRIKQFIHKAYLSQSLGEIIQECLSILQCTKIDICGDLGEPDLKALTIPVRRKENND